MNDWDAAEALLEHRSTKGGYMHGVFYSQEHVDRRGTYVLASAQDLLVS